MYFAVLSYLTIATETTQAIFDKHHERTLSNYIDDWKYKSYSRDTEH